MGTALIHLSAATTRRSARISPNEMKIFLSYASQDRPVADQINRALLEQGHDVFFDRDDLPPGDGFHARIRRAIEGTDLFIFLVSASALDPGSYTLNELEIAERQLKQPTGRLLPVLLHATSIQNLPAFLSSVTLLDSPGNVVAATADAVHRITRQRQRKRLRVIGGLVAVAALVAAVVWSARSGGAPTPETTGTDGAPRLLVPAGTFVMGDADAPPRRELYLDAFHIDKYEVTTARYAKFLAAHKGATPPDGWPDLELSRVADMPVVNVTWNDASAYCAWAGARLPTDAEWEKSARGSDERPYPWGTAAPDLDRANYENASPVAYDGGLATVGSHPAGRSPFGVDDLAGNANEWVADWFADTLPATTARNPVGPATGTMRVIRGGGRLEERNGIASTKRFAAPPELRRPDVGFRCARSVR